MVVPEFTLSQDDQFVYFKIKCPNVRAKEMEMVICGLEFHFWADPYSLVLNFQHKLLDNERGTAKYDIETGWFEARLEKANRGEDFPELMLFTSLKPKREAEKKPLIVVEERTGELEYIDGDFDPTGYGFNCWAKNFFENLEDALPYITDIPEPDSIDLPSRRQFRMERENEDFDPDQIINDYLFPHEYNVAEADVFKGPFTPEQSKKLYGFQHKEFLMSKDNARKCFWQIAEVMYGVVYDTIMFGAEGSCESHWTIGKLSASLSWFDVPQSADDTVHTLVRRTMVYPMFRNYAFAKTCWDKVVELMKEGVVPILKCLMKAVSMIEKGEHRWRLNRLFIEPMISWIQDLKKEEFTDFVNELAEATFPRKENIEEYWCIELLEQFADKQRSEGKITEPQEVERLPL